MRWLCLVFGALLPALGSAADLALRHRIVEREGVPHLGLDVSGRSLVTPTDRPLHSPTRCRVTVTSEAIPEGVLLHYRVANPADGPLDMPDLTIAGIDMPRQGVQIIENWKNVRFKTPREKRITRFLLHAIRRYPGGIYSPVMGVRGKDLFLGAALLYEPMAVGKEVHLDYNYDYDRQRWTMVWRFWDQPAKRVEATDPKTGKKRWRPVPPPVAKIGPGRAFDFTLSVGVAPAQGEQWVTAFRPYRDFFYKTYGPVRYRTTNEPIWARSKGTTQLLRPDNPRGYSSRSAGSQQGRLDLEGWTGFHDWAMKEVWARGFRRMMIWQVAGSYMKHRHCNMVWEIGTGHSPKMLQTCGEIELLRQAGLTVGFWWGRAFSPSMGFDSGERTRTDPDDAKLAAMAFRELDAAYGMGVRLIGCDDSPHSLYPTEWKPSVQVLHRKWFPRLYERYPDMQWVIETAACDFQHVWGSSFMWSREVTGPCMFARYVVPGSESNVTIKRRYGNTTQEWLDQLIRWGYTPIVFNSRFKLVVKRDLLRP